MTDQKAQSTGPDEALHRAPASDEEARHSSGSADVDPGLREKLPALEAVLFMAAEPLPVAELAEILDATPQQAEMLTRLLAADYEGRGIQVTRVAGGYQVCTRPEYGPTVAKLHKPERFRLSRAALETLAIVAYRQPTTKPEVDAIRGVSSDSPLDTLVQYGLVCEAGRKDTPGRPVLYRTTENFLGQFGLNSVEDLPHLESIGVDEDQVKREAQESLPREAEPEGASASDSQDTEVQSAE